MLTRQKVNNDFSKLEILFDSWREFYENVKWWQITQGLFLFQYLINLLNYVQIAIKHFKTLIWYGTLKYGDFLEKFNFLKIQGLRPLNTCQKHFEMILPDFPLDQCEI